MSRRYCMTLDLKDDAELIAEYKRYHEKIWPEITQSIKESGIRDLEIYLRGTRMFMILEVGDDFSFERKAQADRENAKVQEWETLMWKFQKALPGARPGDPRRGAGHQHLLPGPEPLQAASPKPPARGLVQCAARDMRTRFSAPVVPLEIDRF